MSVPTSDARRPTTYISSIAGIVIAWDVCGSCHHHVDGCHCEQGPIEPAFLSAERGPDDPPPYTLPAPADRRLPQQLAVADPPEVPRRTTQAAPVRAAG